jgi:hypothetical protein
LNEKGAEIESSKFSLPRFFFECRVVVKVVQNCIAKLCEKTFKQLQSRQSGVLLEEVV